MSTTRRCDDYLDVADDELLAANAAVATLDLTQGLRAALPTAVVAGIHFANSYINALMALTIGTRTNP